MKTPPSPMSRFAASSDMAGNANGQEGAAPAPVGRTGAAQGRQTLIPTQDRAGARICPAPVAVPTTAAPATAASCLAAGLGCALSAGAANREPVNQHRWLTDAHGHALALLAAGADARIHGHVIADKADLFQR